MTDLNLRRELPSSRDQTTLPRTVPETARISVIGFGPGVLEEKKISSPGELAALVDKFPVLWVHVQGVHDAGVVEKIGDYFKLHDLSIEETQSRFQRAKCETFAEYQHLVAHIIKSDIGFLHEPVNLFFGRNFVLTFQQSDVDFFSPVRKRLQNAQGLLRNSGPDFLAYSLLDLLVDSYFPLLETYGERLDTLEARSLQGGPLTPVREIHRLKRDLFGVRRATWPLRDAINNLLRDSGTLIQPETRLHLREVYDHVVQLIDLIETYRELSSDLMELHLSIASTRMNEVMRVLTIIATIFIPITFIASIYGMNFEFMPELHWHYGYFCVLGIMALIGIGMILWFWRKGWLASFYPSKSLPSEGRRPHS